MELPEFRVTLTRLEPGEPAYDQTGDPLGQRTKFGGKPEFIQNTDQYPACRLCRKPMSFVAQIDSIEHDSPMNPHAVSSLSEERKWMFSDVGMIYVFFCFTCGETDSYTEFY